MSAIAGIFYFDGRPVDKKDLEKIIDNNVIAKRGFDAKGTWCDGPIGLAQRAFWTTPEQELEVQPLVDKNLGLTLVMDGRVDNRSELISGLKSSGVRAPLVTDAEIVLYAYHVWDEDCASKIIGDFAFAIWDSNKQKLICARDALGIRPLYYYKCETFLAFASEALALFELPQIPKRPDLDSMALYLINNFENTEHTEFEKILKLRAAHSMTAKKESFQIKQYWDINPNSTLKLKTIDEYIEAFRETFTGAVTSHLRSNSPLGTTLSGGLDSSSILGLIEDLKTKGKITADISAYSVTFDSPDANESHFIRSIQELWGTKVHWLHSKTPHPLWEVSDAINTTQALWSIEAPILTKLAFNTAAKDGKRVILSGIGGDEFLDTSIYVALELFMAGHPIQAFKLINLFSQYQSVTIPFTMGIVLNAPFKQFRASLPLWLKKLYRSIRPIKTLDWICRPYRDKLFAQMRQKPWYLQNHKFKSLSRQETYSAIYNGYRISGHELLDRLAASTGTIEARHPFCDRRLVELVSSIPDKVMVHGSQPKGLLRAAMHNELPETIRNRMSKGDFTSLVNKLLIYTNKEEAMTLLSNSYLDEIGLIDKKKAMTGYTDFCNKYANNLNNSSGSDIMWQLLSLEYWARNMFGKIENHKGVDYGKRKIAV